MRLYITGGTGLVGSNIIRLARQRADIEIIASQYGPAPGWQVDWQLDPLDMANAAAVRGSILRYQPDAVIHCAAFLDHPAMYRRREAVWKMSVDGNLAFARACAEIGARYVFVSSDWVFDGAQPLVDEDAPPFPVNIYGFMKAVCERDIMGVAGLSYGIGRLAGIYGINYSNPELLFVDNSLGFAQANYVADRLTRGLLCEIWTGPNVNDMAHPTLASDCAEMLLRLAQHDENGIYHCFGSQAVSRIQLAHQLADVFGFDRSLIVPTPSDPAELELWRQVRVPFRTIASGEKTYAALGRRTADVQAGLTQFKAEFDAFYGRAE